MVEASDEYGLDRIFLAALSSSPERLATIAKASSGFVYAVSVMGVTGARTSVSRRLAPWLRTLRLPVRLVRAWVWAFRLVPTLRRSASMRTA